MKNVWLTVAAVAMLGILPSVAHGDTLFDNLSATPGGDDFIGSSYSYGPLADSFTTGASSFSFDSLSLVLNALSPGDGDSFTISLLSDNSTSPGSVLETFATVSDSSLSTSYATYTFTGSSYTLAPSTTYWIELSSPDSSANWFWTLDDTGTGVAGESFYIAQQGGVYSDTDGPYLMAIPGVEVTSTPEAGMFITLAFGLGALFLVSLKRLSRSQICS